MRNLSPERGQPSPEPVKINRVSPWDTRVSHGRDGLPSGTTVDDKMDYPDGNGWFVQEITTRLPGRQTGDSRLTGTSHAEGEIHAGDT
jgi:hypothetical protein